MIRTILSPLAACLLVAGFQTPARAEDPITIDAEAQMQELYKKMAIVLCGKTDRSSMLVLSSPGLMLTEDFDGEGDLVDQGILNEVVDSIPKASPMMISNGGATYSNIYRKIIENHQIPAQFRQTLTPEESKELESLIALTDPSSPEKKKYDYYFDQYWNAVTDADNADQAKARNAAAVRAKVGKVNNEWIASGYKNQIDAAINRIQQITAKTGDAWWNSLLTRLTKAQVGDFLPATFFPKPRTWYKDNSGWTTINFKYGEHVDTSREQSESITAAVSGSYKWFSTDSSFSKNDVSAKSLMSHKDLQISMEVKRVNIMRKWLDQDVFRNKFWTLPQTVSGGVISYGDLVRNQTSKTPVAMPLYVTSLFLVRNLSLKTALTKEEKSSFLHTMDVKAKVGLGPFTLSGGYSKKDQGQTAKTALSDVGITCEGVQIAGFLGSVPPRCPALNVK